MMLSQDIDYEVGVVQRVYRSGGPYDVLIPGRAYVWAQIPALDHASFSVGDSVLVGLPRTWPPRQNAVILGSSTVSAGAASETTAISDEVYWVTRYHDFLRTSYGQSSTAEFPTLEEDTSWSSELVFTGDWVCAWAKNNRRYLAGRYATSQVGCIDLDTGETLWTWDGGSTYANVQRVEYDPYFDEVLVIWESSDPTLFHRFRAVRLSASSGSVVSSGYDAGDTDLYAQPATHHVLASDVFLHDRLVTLGPGGVIPYLRAWIRTTGESNRPFSIAWSIDITVPVDAPNWRRLSFPLLHGRQAVVGIWWYGTTDASRVDLRAVNLDSQSIVWTAFVGAQDYSSDVRVPLKRIIADADGNVYLVARIVPDNFQCFSWAKDGTLRWGQDLPSVFQPSNIASLSFHVGGIAGGRVLYSAKAASTSRYYTWAHYTSSGGVAWEVADIRLVDYLTPLGGVESDPWVLGYDTVSRMYVLLRVLTGETVRFRELVDGSFGNVYFSCVVGGKIYVRVYQGGSWRFVRWK